MGNRERMERSLGERVGDVKLVEEALARAVHAALQRHKQAGNPVAEWRNGEVRWLQPEEIPDFPTETWSA